MYYCILLTAKEFATLIFYVKNYTIGVIQQLSCTIHSMVDLHLLQEDKAALLRL